MQLSVVFPAFNEEANLVRTVELAVQSLRDQCSDFELIIVNDGSTDSTRRVCEELAERFSCVRAIHHAENRGYGAALRSGFAAAAKDLVFFTDSDGQFRFDDLPAFFEAIKTSDMVIGYRARRQDPLWRKMNSRFGNFLARAIFRIRVRDINCAYKLFSRRKLHVLPLASDGALINTELLAFARAAKWSFQEIPVHHYPRKYGQPTGGAPRVILHTLKEYFTIRKRVVAFERQARSGPGIALSDS